MIRHLRLFISSLAIIILVGCYSSPIVKEDALLPEAEANSGFLLVGSKRAWTETDRQDTPTLQLLFRGASVPGQIITATFVKDADLVLQQLPAGEYLIPTSFLGFSHMQFPAPGVRFTIVPRQITYVGDFNASVKWPKIGLLTNRTLSLADNRAEALQRLKLKYPIIAGAYPLRIEVSPFSIRD